MAQVTPGDLDQVFFVSGGSEANESAFKFARAVFPSTGRAGTVANSWPMAELPWQHARDALSWVARRTSQAERSVVAALFPC